MIKVGEARTLIRDHCRQLKAVDLPLMDAAGKLLAEDIIAPHDIPAYRQSSMDGYAFAFSDAGSPLLIKGEQAAGDGFKYPLGKGEAVRIFTGAAVPEGADTILIQEKAMIENGQLIVHASAKQGDHVRAVGSEVKKGSVALEAFRLLTPPAVGYLAAIGVSKARVIPSPRIAIIVTGNELLKPGESLEYGKVFEASSFALVAALQGLGFHEVKVSFVKDDLASMTERLKEGLMEADLVLMTGGVSVGDHDHTVEAARNAGVEQVFHRVKQKPGKPLFFGVKDEKAMFGLPGNPSSVLTCFYEYVLPALSIMTGRDLELQTAKAELAMDHRKPAGLTHFLKGQHQDGKVTVSGAQESYKLNSFALANCFIVLPEDEEVFKAGDQVDIHLLPV